MTTFADAIGSALLSQIDELSTSLPDDPAFDDFVGELRGVIHAGGKRLRPEFCKWGYLAGGGDDLDALVPVAAALEFVHMCALVHDDVMDNAGMRRGRPTTQVSFARIHAERGWPGDADAFGRSAAILIGDLAFVLADRMMITASFPFERVAAAYRQYTEMRVEVTAGQFLDLVESRRHSAQTEVALTVAELKTSRYTVERPLLVGAALNDPDAGLGEALSRYGRPLGLAFQLRDDLLGAFGDETHTGKPVGGDFREGKQTYLLARTREAAGPAELEQLDALVGNAALDAADVAQIQQIVIESGARDDTEAIVEKLSDEAIAVLHTPGSPVEPEAAAGLETLARSVAFRDS